MKSGSQHAHCYVILCQPKQQQDFNYRRASKVSTVMPVCPKCNTTYTSVLKFCSNDGTPLLHCSDDVYLPLGARVSGLIVRERLKTDALGVVYKCSGQGGDERAFCVRLFHPELINADLYGRLETVGVLLKQGLNIPEIPAGYTVAVLDDGRRVFVTEYIPGVSLESFIQTGGRMQAKAAVALLFCIGEILEKAHRAGFTHGGLNPENILLVQEHTSPGHAERSRIKLLDFGVGRTIASYDPTALRRCAAELLGKDTTVFYAPEIFSGSRDQAGEKADVYSLGALCYYLLTGQHPFTRTPDNNDPTYITDSPRQLTMINSSFGVPPSLEKVMLHALSYDPKGRPMLSEFLRDLQQIEFEVAVAARTPSKPLPQQMTVTQTTESYREEDLLEEPMLEPLDSEPSVQPPQEEAPLPQKTEYIRQERPSRTVMIERTPITSQQQIPSPVVQQVKRPQRKVRVPLKYWVMFIAAAIGFLLVTGILSLALFQPKVGSIIVTTVPVGAQIELDGKIVGQAPAELEQVPAGTHKLRIIKQGFIPIEREVVVTARKTVTLPMLSLQPEKTSLVEVAGTPEARIDEFNRLAEEAFARGDYLVPEGNNAFYFCNAVLTINPNDQRGLDMMNRIKEALIKQAETAQQKNDFATAQQIYTSLLEKFPNESRAVEGLKKLELELSARRGQLSELQASGEEAFRKGNLIEPPQASAYYYAAQMLAIEPSNAAAQRLRQRVKEALNREAEAAAQEDPKTAIPKFEQLARLFPEDKRVSARLKALRDQAAQQTVATNDPRKRRETGMQKYSAGDYSGAAADLEVAVKGGLRDIETLFYLANANWKRGQVASAINYFHQVLDQNPNHVPTLVSLAQIAENRDDDSMALTYYERALRTGGSAEYSRAFLEKRIEALKGEAAPKEKVPEPFSANVTHEHLFGSCSGRLSVNQQGVNFSTNETDHGFVVPLNGVTEIQSSGAEKVSLKVLGKKYNFKFPARNGDKFKQAYIDFKATGR